MALADILIFENPGVVAIAIGILVFILALTMLKKSMGKGVGTLISLIIGALSSYYLYKNWLYEPSYNQNVMAAVLIILVAVIIIKIFWSFIKAKRNGY